MYKNVNDLLKEAAKTDKGITFIENNVREEFLTYCEILHNSRKMLGGMQNAGMKQGDEVIFQFVNIKQFVFCFWACILGGIIPVPVPLCDNKEKMLKVKNVWNMLERPHLIMDIQAGQLFGTMVFDWFTQNKEYHYIAEEFLEYEIEGEETQASKDDIAIIQFSSGSTGRPKGVILTHGNLLTNISAMIAGAGFNNEDTVLSWLPLTHDMGLIGSHMTAVAVKVHQYLMPTVLFIKKPLLWFDKMSEHSITITLAPNFAYKYILDSMDTEKLYDWDLSSLREIFNGAEPISVEMCETFLKTMQMYKLKENVILDVYGMAESSLGVSFPEPGTGLSYQSFARESLSIGKSVCLCDEQEKALRLVNLGQAIPNGEIRICDKLDHPVSDGIVGQIQIKGQSVTKGYYHDEENTRNLFTIDGWLKTGDVGFFYSGNLYVSGREKEILFVNGQNFYPYDIEVITESVMQSGEGKAAVCGIWDAEYQRDKICLFVVCPEYVTDFFNLEQTLKLKLMQTVGVHIDVIIPVDEIPKTDSGKIKRVQLKEMYLSDAFSDILQQIENQVQNQWNIANLEPVTNTEKKLLELCKEFIEDENREKLQLNASFMELGLDSVRLLKLTTKIKEEFGKEIQVADLFAHPTVRKIAEFLDSDMQIKLPSVIFPDARETLNVYIQMPGFYHLSVPINTVLEYSQVPEIISTALQTLEVEKPFSFHSILEKKDVIVSYIYRENILQKERIIPLKRIAEAKCGTDEDLRLIIYKRKLNQCNRNLKKDYDICIECEIDEDGIDLYLYSNQKIKAGFMKKLTETILYNMRKDVYNE